jgi:hypothetical protein
MDFNLTEYLRKNPLTECTYKTSKLNESKEVSKLREIIRNNIISVLNEKKETEDEVEVEDTSSNDTEGFMDLLEDLKKKALAFGDDKLNKQIDNTITYFTRQHVVTQESLSLNERRNEEMEGQGLIVTTSTSDDYNILKKFFEESDFYAIENKVEEYFFLPEENFLDSLESDLTKALDEMGVNYTIESQFN